MVGGLRFAAIAVSSVIVVSCSGTMPTMHDLSLTMPKIELPDFGLGTKPERFAPAESYALSTEEVRELQSSVRAAFPHDWDVAFLSGNAGRLRDGTVAVCGLVTARGSKSENARSYLYRAGQDQVPVARGTGKFELRQIASRRGEQFGIYSNCSSMRLM